MSHPLANTCPCEACRWIREEAPEGCFAPNVVIDGGHGECVHDGCICRGTAADGECEACWVFHK